MTGDVKKNSRRTAFMCILIIMLLVFLDQYTKYLSVLYLKQKSDIYLIPGILHLHYLYPENRGIAFGMMQGGIPLFVILTLALAGFIIFMMVRMPKTKHYRPLLAVCILILSGAFGNLIDRVLRRYVVDFIYFVPIDFPVFNLADVFVVTGCILLVILTLFFYKDEEDFGFLQKGK